MEAASTASSASSSLEAVGGSPDYLNLGMFSTSSLQQHSGDVLVGSGFGSALGNGFGSNDVTASSVGGVAGSSASSTTATTSNTTGTSFDLSDFPSLGGGVGVSSSANSNAGGLAAALRQQQLLAHQQQQQQQQQQQMLQPVIAAAKGGAAGASGMYRLPMTGSNGNFNMATEDFPVLSGGPAPPPTTGSSVVGVGGVAGSNGPLSVSASSLLGNANSVPSISRTPSNGGASGLYGDLESGPTTHLEGAAPGLLAGAGLTGLGGLRALQSNATNPTPVLPANMSRAPASIGAGTIGTALPAPPASSSGPVAGSALQGDYGLLGLLGVIRMTDADRNALALGSDLTLLGLNLGSAEHIYNTLTSPWLSTDSSQPTKDPHYQLPSCYYMQPPALKTGHLSKFQLETLFYIFYALPKDVLQAYAAQELYSREWRYHGELKLWFKRVGPSDGLAVNTSTGSTQYLYFDINSWERRLFNVSLNQNLSNGFLPEEDVRVKFPNS